MKKKLYTIISLVILSAGASSQQSVKDWTVSFGVGYGNYYGDLSHYSINSLSDWKNVRYFFKPNFNYIKLPSLHLSAEKHLSERSGLLLSANLTNIRMSDRYVDANGVVQTNSTNYDRALNFRSEIYDLGLAYKWRTSSNAFISPQFWIGGGVNYFRTLGDLFDRNGNGYDYSETFVNRDERYETNLRNERTETETKYSNIAPFVNFGLGINFRISKAVSFAIESDVKYALTDYLDDVSGTYRTSYASAREEYIAHPGVNNINAVTRQRGRNDNMNDFYVQNRFVLRYSLSKDKYNKASQAFYAPPVYPVYYDNFYSDTVATVDADAVDTLNTTSKQTDSIKSDTSRRLNSDVVVVADSLRGIKSQISAEKVSLSFGDVPALSNGSVENHVDTNTMMQKIAHLEKRVAELEIEPVRSKYIRSIDSVEALMRTIEGKKRPSANESLRMQIYRLQIDSIKQVARQENVELPSKTKMNSAGSENNVRRDTVNIPARNSGEISVNRIQHDTVKVSTNDLQQANRKVRGDSINQSKIKLKQRERNGLDSNAVANSVPSDSTSLQAPGDSGNTRSIQEVQVETNRRKVAEVQKKLDSLEQVFRDSMTTKEQQARRSQPRPVESFADTTSARQLEELNVKIEQLLAREDSARYDPAVNEAMYQANVVTLANDSITISKLQQQVDRNRQMIEDKKADVKWYDKVFKTSDVKELEAMQRQNEDLENRVNQRQLSMNRLVEQNRMLETRLQSSENIERRIDRRYSRDIDALHDEIRRLRIEMGNSQNYQPVFIPAPANLSQPSDMELEIAALRDELKRFNAQDDSTMQDPGNAAMPNQQSMLKDSLTAFGAMIDSLRKEIAALRTVAVNNEKANAAPEVETRSTVILNKIPAKVYYELGSTEAAEEQLASLDKLESILRDAKVLKISLNAYTDATGNKSINEKIARKRALNVREYLTEKFNVGSADMFEVQIHLSSNKGAKSNALNRRVEVQLSGYEPQDSR